MLKAYTEDATSGSLHQMMCETLLQKEFGISIDDLYYEKSTDHAGVVWDYMAYSGENTDEYQRLYAEERKLYSIFNRYDWIEPKEKFEYELDFSYINEVVLERGVDDMEGMKKRLTAEFDPRYEYGATKDFTLTVDRDGKLVDCELEKVKGLDEEKHARLINFEKSLLISNVANQGATEPGKYYNPFAWGKMATLTADSRRLMQYEFGIATGEFDDFKIEIIGRIDEEPELNITAVKKGMADILGGDAAFDEESGGEIEPSERLTMFSISSEHPAFAVDVRNVIKKEDVERFAKNPEEIPVRRQISVQLSPFLEKSEADRYLSTPSDFMKKMMNKAYDMFLNNTTNLNHPGLRV